MRQAQSGDQLVQSQITCNEDEIDLGEIFRKIGRGKSFIFWTVALTVLAVFAFGVVWLIQDPPITQYSNIIRFNFPTAQQGKYPSGQRFSRNDIVSSSVLAKVYERNHLDQRGITLDDFAGAITIAPYAPMAEFISAKYQKLLSDKKLTPADIAELSKKYQQEMEAAQERFAQISYTSLAGLGLSDEQIRKILIDIPQVWSITAIHELGVLDLPIPSAKFFQPQLIDTYEYIQAVQYLKESAEVFRGVLDSLSKDEIGAQVRDPKTGLMVSDLQAQLDSMFNFLINPLVPLVASSGLARSLVDATVYTRNKIQQIQDQIATLEEKSKIYQMALDQYAKTSLQRASTVSIPSTQTMSSENGIVQYGSDFLSKITDLVEKQKDAEFRQQLLQKQVELRLQIADLKAQLQHLTRAMRKYERLAKGKDDVIVRSIKQSIENKMAETTKQFVRLIESYQNIRNLRNEQIIGHTGALYEQAVANIQVSSDLLSRIKKLVLIAVGLGVLALFASITIVLIRRSPEVTVSQR